MATAASSRIILRRIMFDNCDCLIINLKTNRRRGVHPLNWRLEIVDGKQAIPS